MNKYFQKYYQEHRKKYLARASQWAKDNKKRISENNRKLTKKRRLELIETLGSKCMRCGFRDWRALQVDHVNGDGQKDQLRKHGANRNFYKKVMKDTTGKYQLLCANCNWIKRYENNEHGG